MEKHYTPKEASLLLGLTVRHIQRLDKEGKIKCIRTPGGRRRIPESEIKRLLGEKRRKVLAIYGRVSSHEQKQKGDLKRQINYLTEVTQSSRFNPGAVCKVADGWNSDGDSVSANLATGLGTRTGTWKLKRPFNHTFLSIKLL